MLKIKFNQRHIYIYYLIWQNYYHLASTRHSPDYSHTLIPGNWHKLRTNVQLSIPSTHSHL